MHSRCPCLNENVLYIQCHIMSYPLLYSLGETSSFQEEEQKKILFLYKLMYTWNLCDENGKRINVWYCI